MGLLGGPLGGLGLTAGPAAGGDPAITDVAPTSEIEGSDANLVITLANMPAGFTLDDIKINAISANTTMKNSDTEVFGSWMMPAAGSYNVTVEYNTTESVTALAAFAVNPP